MSASRRDAIQKQVDALLKEHGITSAPIPIERIAKALGVQVKYSPLDDELSGMAYVKDGTPIIGINTLHHPNRQRFALAHELGHLILHENELTKEIHVDKGFHMYPSSSAGEDEMEIEANRFANEILMPESLLAKSLNGQSFDIDDDALVSALTKEYKVSVSAMRFRLGNLFTR